MGEGRAREPRRAVFLSARVQTDEGWRDIQILNLSSRGVGAQLDNPPCRGTYIEIRYRSQIIIGRVVWVQDNRLGIYTQDKLDVDAILNEPTIPYTGQERRRTPRPEPAALPVTPPSLEQQAERSRRFAATFQFGALTLTGLFAALLLATLLFEALNDSLRQVNLALQAPQR